MNNDYLTELKDELVTKENKLLKLNCILDKLSIVENEELYAEENNFIEDNRIEPNEAPRPKGARYLHSSKFNCPS